MAAWRDRGVAHLAKILMPPGKARAAKMRAPDRVAREPAAMSAKVVPAAVVSTKAVASAVMSVAAAMAVPAAMTTTVAAAAFAKRRAG
jgi:hypothetical protein